MSTHEYIATNLVPYANLASSKCCSLKINDPRYRVWRCRVHGGVTVETKLHGDWVTTSGHCHARVALLDTANTLVPAKDWVVSKVKDLGPGQVYRYHVVGINLNFAVDHPSRHFGWWVPSLDDERYDLTNAEVA